MKFKKVFVVGLPSEATDKDILASFTKFGPVQDARVQLDHKTNKSRGFAYVVFKHK